MTISTTKKIPQVGETITVSHKTDGDHGKAKLWPHTIVERTITLVYAHGGVRDSAGDVWKVQPCVNGWRAVA